MSSFTSSEPKVGCATKFFYFPLSVFCRSYLSSNFSSSFFDGDKRLCDESSASQPRPFLVLVRLWLLLLILAPGGEQSGILSKATLRISPPWIPAFKGEKVKLKCVDFDFPPKGHTSWFRDKKALRDTSEEITIKTSGYYQCKTPRSSLSDSVLVEFLSDWLILQASHPVFEGDDVFLRCRGKEEKKIIEKTYYRDKEELRGSFNADTFRVNPIFRDHDEYHCAAYGESVFSDWTVTSKSLKIQVQELFTQPVLTVSPSKLTEGGPVTLACETELAPLKSGVQLQFCFFRDGKILGSGCSSSAKLQIPTLWSKDSGSYWCKAETESYSITKRSQKSQIHVQRIPVSEVNLETQPPEAQLIEGENLVLICSVAKGTGAITFSWHRDGTGILGRKTQQSLRAELQVPAVKERDAGRYYCTADNNDGPILSNKIRVAVRSPVSRPILILETPRAQAVVGDVMELHCEVLRGSTPILYQFYRGDVILGTSTAPFGGRASFNLSLTAEHSGNYSCEADNGLGAQHSPRVSLKVTVPVSRPVLTFGGSEAGAVEGDVVELHCEALRGSPPILYQFYYENVTLGNSSALAEGGVSFQLSLTVEHSGNYSCEADNGLGPQRSESKTLSVTGISRSRAGDATAGVIGGLLGTLGLAGTAALMIHVRTQRKSGGLSGTGTPSYNPNEHEEPSLCRPSRTDPQETTHCVQLTPMEPQPVYSNVYFGNTNTIYSQILIQPTKETPVNSPRMTPKDKEPVVIYAKMKKAPPDNLAEQTSRRGSAQEDATGNYENI